MTAVSDDFEPSLARTHATQRDIPNAIIIIATMIVGAVGALAVAIFLVMTKGG